MKNFCIIVLHPFANMVIATYGIIVIDKHKDIDYILLVCSIMFISIIIVHILFNMF